MNSHLTTTASYLARLLALLPTATVAQCQEQDLAVADVLDMLIAACEGNGDAAQCMQRAVEDIRGTVAMDRAEQVEA